MIPSYFFSPWKSTLKKWNTYKIKKKKSRNSFSTLPPIMSTYKYILQKFVMIDTGIRWKSPFFLFLFFFWCIIKKCTLRNKINQNLRIQNYIWSFDFYITLSTISYITQRYLNGCLRLSLESTYIYIIPSASHSR